MNKNSLTKHYDKLTTRERFSLLLEAVKRNDELELDRIASASPKLYLEVTDYQRMGGEFIKHLWLWMARCLENVVLFEAVGNLLVSEDEESGDKQRIDKLTKSAAIFARQFKENWQAFELALEQIGISRKELDPSLPGIDAIETYLVMRGDLMFDLAATDELWKDITKTPNAPDGRPIPNAEKDAEFIASFFVE